MHTKGFWYLATPYSRFPGGIEEAFRAASREAALYIKAGIPVFCPIAHSHPIAVHGAVDAFDHDIWMPADRPMMDAAIGLIVIRMESWEQSKGIAMEIEAFRAAGKPIVYTEPGYLPIKMMKDALSRRFQSAIVYAASETVTTKNELDGSPQRELARMEFCGGAAEVPAVRLVETIKTPNPDAFLAACRDIAKRKLADIAERRLA